MKRLGILVIIAVLFLIGRAYVQGIQHKEIQDFSGGLVNSFANSVMQDNQALVLVNYDVVNGDLKRRNGITRHYVDAESGNITSAIFAYYQGIKKKVLTIRSIPGAYGDDRDSLYVVALCVDSTETCTTIVYEAVFPFERNKSYPFNITSAYINDVLVMAATQSDPLIFDGTNIIPMRARTFAQPNAVGLVGGGNLTGTFRYKYAFRNSAFLLSNMSAPSWEVTVNRGKAVVFGIGPVADSTQATGQVMAYIYREKDFDGHYEKLDSVRLRQSKPITYLDNIANTVDADTTDFRHGPLPPMRPRPANRETPGSFTVTLDTALDTVFSIGPKSECGAYECSTLVGYSIIAVDTFGGKSMACPPIWTFIGQYPDSLSDGRLFYSYHAIIKGWPTPVDSGIVKYKLLRAYACGSAQAANRGYSDCGLLSGGDFVTDSSVDVVNWYYLPDFEISVDSVVDSARPHFYSKPVNLYCEGVNIHDSIFGDTGIVISQYAYGEMPESTCYDSAILSRPSAVIEHGFRLYAVDDNGKPNNLLYSEFASPTKWPSDKRLNIPSRSGDWLNNLMSLGNNVLFGTRQNSAIGMSGHSFFQFTVDDVIEDIGAQAPRSLAYGRNTGAFTGASGTHLFGRGGDVISTPASLPIQNSLDSADTNIIRTYSRFVGDELWVSMPVGATRNNRTYIFDLEPTPLWKVYDFGVVDMAEIDVDTLLQTYNPKHWIFIRGNDSLYRWNYKDTAFDPGDIIIAKYQSKYFFDDGFREKIFYVDIFGEGTGGTLSVILWRNKGVTSDTIEVALDFSAGRVNRARFNVICENASVGWFDNGLGAYTITGYRIGMSQWDEGSNR